jgi:1-deoxy-D-xylulose-5-phosphate synthase
MTIMAPSNEQELRDMLFTAVATLNGPVAVRYPRGSATGLDVRREFQSVPVGKAVLRNEGNDLAILAVGTMVEHALQAAALLREDDIGVAVYDMRFVKPMDEELVADIARRMPHIMTLEDNSVLGGFGSGVAEFLTTMQDVRVRLHIHGIPDHFIEQGSQSQLYADLEMDGPGLASHIRSILGAEPVSAASRAWGE